MRKPKAHALIALVVAGLATVVAFAGGAGATYPGSSNGRLAFGVRVGGNTDLYSERRRETGLPGATASAATAAAPVSCGRTFDTTTIRSSFPLRLRITLPTRHWCMLYGDVPGAIDPVHVGRPMLDEEQWWGPSIALVDGARVVRRADALRPATTPTIGTSRPWPADFLGYVASLPQVQVVTGPSPVAIGGIRGTRITVKTPPMHPLLWLRRDSAWVGGGQAGLDPAGLRELILLRVHGKKLLLTSADPAALFAARLSEVHVLWRSIEFER